MIEINDEYFMRKALQQAQLAFEENEIPIGAVIVINNKIISRAHNQVELLNDPTAHAEILAITSACNLLGTKYLPDAILYVTIEPCLMCCGALYWSKVSKIIYGAADEKNGFNRYFENKKEPPLLPFHQKAKVEHGLLATECAQLMKDFFKERR